MLLVRREPDNITRSDFLDRSAVALRPPKARRDNQRLAEGMRMPGSPSTRLERDACATYTRRFRRLEQRIYAHPTGEPVSRSFRRRL